MISIFTWAVLLPNIVAAEAQLTILIQQGRQQIEEIQKILKAQNLEISQIEQLQKHMSQLDAEVSSTLEQFRASPEYEQALLEIQAENENQLLKLEGSNSKTRLAPEERKEKVNRFQDTSLFANQEDLAQIAKIKSLSPKASAADVARVNLFAQASQWEAIVRLSAQTAQLLQALQSISEKLEENKNPQLLSSGERELIQSALEANTVNGK